MASPFSDTLRSLQSDRSATATMALLVASGLLLVWSIWFFVAEMTISAVSSSARVELSGASDVIAPDDGQITAIYKTVGQDVRRADLLFALETASGPQNIRALAAGQLQATVGLRLGLAVQRGDRLAVIAPAGNLQITATFPTRTLGQIRAGMPASLHIDSTAWSHVGAIPVQVQHVAQESRSGQVEAVFALSDPQAFALQHGLQGQIDIALERLSPAELVLRAANQFVGGR